MNYQLAPLYQLILEVRAVGSQMTNAQFAYKLEKAEAKVVFGFLEAHRQYHRQEGFSEFIKDHFLSLISYEDKLFRIPPPFHELLRTCIDNLKYFLITCYPTAVQPHIDAGKAVNRGTPALFLRLRSWLYK